MFSQQQGWLFGQEGDHCLFQEGFDMGGVGVCGLGWLLFLLLLLTTLAAS